MPRKIIEALRKITIGFFGWFMLANIAFVTIAFLMVSIPSMAGGFVLVFIGIWVPTVIALIILFATKRIATGSGILIAAIFNGVVAGAPFYLSAARLGMTPFYILRMMLLPFPSAGIVYFMAVMTMVSPPYTNLGHLLDFYRLFGN